METICQHGYQVCEACFSVVSRCLGTGTAVQYVPGPCRQCAWLTPEGGAQLRADNEDVAVEHRYAPPAEGPAH